MSARATVRALPALLRTGVIEAVAYRAELVVWMLSTTLPLVMLALFQQVAREGPLGRFDEQQVGVYFLMTFLVRQLTGSWISWQMNMEVREGTLAMRLLRPVHPVAGYACENLAALPLRALVAVPLSVAALAWNGGLRLPDGPLAWALALASVAMGWVITFSINVAVGSLSFFTQSSLKVMDLYVMLFFALSGYTVPVELFPPWLRDVSAYLPFRYQVGLPVELLTSAHAPGEAARLVAAQLGQAAAWATMAGLMFRRGVARFEAYGG